MNSPPTTFSLTFRLAPPPPPPPLATRPAFVFLPLGLAPPPPSSTSAQPGNTGSPPRGSISRSPPRRAETSFIPDKSFGPVRHKHTKTRRKFEPYQKGRDARKQVKAKQADELPRPEVAAKKRLKPQLKGVERGSERTDGGRRKNKQKISAGGKRWRDLEGELDEFDRSW